jgi:hypothetical protein
MSRQCLDTGAAAAETGEGAEEEEDDGDDEDPAECFDEEADAAEEECEEEDDEGGSHGGAFGWGSASDGHRSGWSVVRSLAAEMRWLVACWCARVSSQVWASCRWGSKSRESWRRSAKVS